MGELSLRLYNVTADRGKETSQVYQKKGLLYHIIDERGVPVGKSIKASDFLLKPTLVNLEKRFILNPDNRLSLKAFHAVIEKEDSAVKVLPMPIVRQVTQGDVQADFLKVKREIKDLEDTEIRRMLGDPSLVGLVVKR